MLVYILYFLLVVMIVMLWLGIANELTYKNRISRIPFPLDDEFYEKLAIFRSVSYDKHLWYVYTFRNPEVLYNKGNNLHK